MRLRDAKRGQRVRLADGRVLTVIGPCTGDVWAREYLGDEEWLPGKVAAREGELFVAKGDWEVTSV